MVVGNDVLCVCRSLPHVIVLSHMPICSGEGNGSPLQCSCLENPRDGGAWWAAVCGVTRGWTRLKALSSSSSSPSALKLVISWNAFSSISCLLNASIFCRDHPCFRPSVLPPFGLLGSLFVPKLWHSSWHCRASHSSNHVS